jgi:2-dehydro-3-deoxygluconokinase
VTDVVTLGETMAVFTSASVGPLRHATSLTVGAAGAESNMAIGLRRLGASVAWIGRVGDDELGQLVLARLRGEDVDVRGAVVDPGAPTGLMVKERRTGTISRVHYYRRGSAGSRLGVDDVDEAAIVAARILHVTGITPALSDTARAAVSRAVEVARAAGTLVSLDYNYRSALWSPEEAREVLRVLTARADVVFAGEEETELVAGAPTVEALAALGPREAIVKRGAKGAVAAVGGVVCEAPAVPVRVVDPVGAGDAFVAAYLAGLLEGHDPEERLRAACAAGAFAVTVDGDWEGFPTRAELTLLARPDGTVLR